MRDQPTARSRQRSAGLGGLAAIIAVAVTLTGFFPLGRLFDPSTGGDEPLGLFGELVVGAIGGLMLSPVSAAIGAVAGYLIGDRRVGPGLAVGLVAIGACCAFGLFAILTLGELDGGDSYSSLRFAICLGALAGAIAVAIFVLARRALGINPPIPAGS